MYINVCTVAGQGQEGQNAEKLLINLKSTMTLRPRRITGGTLTQAVVLKFFVERTFFTKSLMATKKELNIIVNKKQRT